ncbi:MAG: hypothetical protein Q8916_02175 [Bacteroidota bacterium]|nr:hypothetical protein [Bacteroidota bacterium]MDP4229193.1 hypothetical protein [Bacteroidota bacterium]MDP4236713.1 hypothetical protein [Bacteroidota bacterium]
MAMLHDHDNDSDAVKIAHDKEKTKRFTLYIASLALVAIFGIYFVFRASDNGGTRKFDLDLKGGKIDLSVDKPIVAQIGLPTSGYQSPNGEIQFTTGKVDEGFIKQIETSSGSLSPTAFSGKNFVNKEAGFLFSVEHPENWKVIPSLNMSTRATIINNFESADNSQNNLNVVIDKLPRPENITEYVNENVSQMLGLGLISQEPGVSYDSHSNTAFLYYHNLHTGGPTIQKFIIDGDRAFVATANRSESGGNGQILADMEMMISTFTLIGKNN